MKHFKRILIFVLALLSLIILPTFNADESFTEVLGARYRVTSVEEENELAYGVKHYRHFAESSTSKSGGNAAGSGGGGPLEANKLYPQQVNYLEVPSSKYVRVVNWSTTTKTRWNLNTVRAIANDYERNHPGWKVIAAINGDFFDINAKKNLPYQTNGASVSGGDYYKSVSDSTVGFTNNGTVNSLIGGEKLERTPYMVLGIYDENNEIIQTFQVKNVNTVPGANEASVYYANWNKEKQIVPIQVPNVGSVFVVENAEKALANASNDFYGRGTITSTTPKELGEGEFAIVSNNSEINQVLAVGVRIRIQYEYIGAYAEITDATGAGATLLKNGVAYDGDANRHPRTMIGRRADGTIVMVVVDGRQPSSNMYGAVQEEMAAIMHHYGCVDAFNLDGGGSSTLIIREGSTFRVTNSPSDGRERTDANAILVVAYDPKFQIEAEVGLDSLKIKASLLDNNGLDIEQVFFKLNNEEKELTNGELTFTNLNSNTNYVYNIYIKLKTGEKLKIVTQGTLTTAKRTGILKGLSYEIKGNELIVTVDFNDNDNSITRARVYLYGDNEKAAYINNGIAIIRNPGVEPEGGYWFTITYRVEKNDGKPFFEIILRNPHSLVANYVDVAVTYQKQKTLAIIK